jgi:hypothetical protein
MYHFLITQLAVIANIFFVHIPVVHRFHKTSHPICLPSAHTGVFPSLTKGVWYFLLHGKHPIRPCSVSTVNMNHCHRCSDVKDTYPHIFQVIFNFNSIFNVISIPKIHIQEFSARLATTISHYYPN